MWDDMSVQIVPIQLLLSIFSLKKFKPVIKWRKIYLPTETMQLQGIELWYLMAFAVAMRWQEASWRKLNKTTISYSVSGFAALIWCFRFDGGLKFEEFGIGGWYWNSSNAMWWKGKRKKWLLWSAGNDEVRAWKHWVILWWSYSTFKFCR